MKKSVLIILLVIACLGLIAAGAYSLAFKKTPPTSPSSEKKVVFSNGQPYRTFEEGGFKMSYPDWTKINFDTSAPDADKIKVAVSNAEGCSFFLKIKELPQGQDLKAYTEQVTKSLGDRMTINTSDVKENEAFLDADIKVDGDVTMRNVSRVFKSGQTIYSIAFVAEKNAFSNACRPIVDEVMGSVVLK